MSLPKLGLRPPHPAGHAHRRVKLASYLKPTLAAPPPVCDWTEPVRGWGLYRNDEIGDCAIAAEANLLRLWTANTVGQRDVELAEVLATYEALSGYDPATNTRDDGVVLSDALARWRDVGFSDDCVDGFAEVEPKVEIIQRAVALFGGCVLVTALPAEAQAVLGPRADAGHWTAPPDLLGPRAPGSWGLHAPLAVRYGAGRFGLVTWGQVVEADDGWLAAYCVEAWAVVSGDWLRASGISPSGLDLAALREDLARVRYEAGGRGV